jgi:hypothetical protein
VGYGARRPVLRLLPKTFPQCNAGRLYPPGRAELSQNVGYVDVRGLVTYEQAFRDLPIRTTDRKEPEDFELARWELPFSRVHELRARLCW